MNKLDTAFQTNKKPLLSIYTTAGYPDLDSLMTVLPALEKAGCDFVEIGIPFSDPLADGPIIQQSSQQALKNGMNLNLLFKQLEKIKVGIPLVMMGYLNPILQFGVEKFLSECARLGISGTIIPDLPLHSYKQYKALYEKYNIHNILLITPQTPPERIRLLGSETRGFLYAVSSSTTTGTKGMTETGADYLSSLKKIVPEIPVMIGFGIKTAADFRKATEYADGGIIGSRFIELLKDNKFAHQDDLTDLIAKFVTEIRL